LESRETRVRMGAKQTSKGTIQLDLTAEAPSVEEAGELLSKALREMLSKIHLEGLKATHENDSS